MDTLTQIFCKIIRQRSAENRRAIELMSVDLGGPLSPAFSVLRQELDSMVRAVFLLSINDLSERRRLIQATLDGRKWRVVTVKGKWRDVTDREMVDLSQLLQGWTRSVYKFGCAFIHLSNLHNHLSVDPFRKLSETERQDILTHMRYYHGGPASDDLTMDTFVKYIPAVFDKIAGNLECYVKDLEGDQKLEYKK